MIKTSNDASVRSRVFACIADVLGCKAKNRGGLRSGPAANHLWKKGLLLLEVIHDIYAYGNTPIKARNSPPLMSFKR